MAKTDKSTSFRRAKFEVQVTTAMAAALSPLITAEWLDLSSIFAGPLEQLQARRRDFETFRGLTDVSPTVLLGAASVRRYRATFLYTEGETIGTDNLDPYQDLFLPLIDYEDGALSVPFRWSPKGGNSGDNQYTTSGAGSYVLEVTDAVGGVDSNKVMFAVEWVTEALTPSTVV